MSIRPTWSPIEGSPPEILSREPQPFRALAQGTVPAFVVRGGFPLSQCRAVVDRLRDSGHIELRPDGAYDAVGTSLVNRGADPEAFFRHAEGTRRLFASLFDGIMHPVEYLYRTLQALAPDRSVKLARQPDGRLYGPAIFRLYPAGKGHVPHFDSIRLREAWSQYEVCRFDHQYAAVLCLQATDPDQEAGEAIIHRQRWSPELQPVLDEERFGAYAAERNLDRTTVRLEAGDFYVFNPIQVHEVPIIQGTTPRIVLATFLGFSEEDPQVYVWS